MDDLTVIYKIQRSLHNSLQTIGDTMISGGVDNMEKYKYLLGQAHAIQLTLQEISNLLKDEKEQTDESTKDDNVIDFYSRSTED